MLILNFDKKLTDEIVITRKEVLFSLRHGGYHLVLVALAAAET